MDKIFTLKNYKIASLIFAFLFLFLAVFKINDISKFSFEALTSPNYLALLIGTVFLILSIVLYLELGIDIFNLNTVKIKRLKNDTFNVKIGRSKIFVHFDKIEEIKKKEGSIVVLPANEYFDDECINDRRSSLGAYIEKHFKNQVVEIQAEVKNQIIEKSIPSTLQSKKEGENQQPSYGIASSVLLTSPLNTSENILLIAVTEQRAGLGLYSNMSFVYRAVNEIHRKAVDNRLRNIYIPLLGSGHGGLNKRVAFLSLVTAFAELLKKNQGTKIDSLNIVIFKDDKSVDISKKIVKRILKFGIGLALSDEKEETLSKEND